MFQFENPKHRAIIQSLFWIIATIFIYWLPNSGDADRGFYVQGGRVLLVQIALIWINIFWLFPKLFIQHKKIIYALSIIGIALALGFIFMPPDHAPNGRHPKKIKGMAEAIIRFGITFFPIFISIIGTTLLEIWEIAQQKSRENIRLVNEKLSTELKFLKSQINPHFLFNALNNIYTLSVLKSEKTSDSIARLSDMLRYVLYDCEKDKVPLSKELDYIRDYIALCQLKKEGGLNIQVDLPISNIGAHIPPMLFIPFIENAIKHSHIEDRAKGWIRIHLKNNSQQIEFKVENSIPKRQLIKDKTGGIGLENVKKRLNILFPKKHDLLIQAAENVYKVVLRLEL